MPADTSFHTRARELMGAGGAIEDCIEIQKKAVDELRRGENSESAVDVLSQMGYLYSRSGDFLKGLMFLQEASDSLSARGHESLNEDEIVGAIRLFGNTSNLYTRMGLYDEALELSDRAIALSEGRKDGFRSDLYRMRAAMYRYQSKFDSMLVCEHKAVEAAGMIPDSIKRDVVIARIQNEIAWAYIENPDFMPDSISAAVKVLESNITKSTAILTDSLLMGRGYVLLGNPSKGISVMRTLIPSFRQRGEEDHEFALRMLVESIVESSLSPEDLEIYRMSRHLTDSMTANLKANALVGADFRYRTSRILSDKLLLERELALTRQRNILGWLTLFLITAFIVVLVVYIVRRKNRLLETRRAEIDSLIGERIRLNMEIERIKSDMLCRMKKDDDDNDKSKSEDISDTSEIFSIVLLTQEDEARFRQLFSTLNPGFIENIRVRYPEISPNAELVLMLIRLRKSNDEIALVLGIKRDSVTKARYRLRSLFGLPKETELNDFIMHM